MASVWGELKRRNVVRVAVAYAIVSWLILQLTDVLIPLLDLPEWVGRFVFLLLVIGLLLALILSWAYELTPQGVKLEKNVDRSESISHITGRKIDFVIIGVLTVALLMFALDKFVWTESSAPVTTADTDRRTIAVLPFINMSSDPEQEYFSDGLAEELLNLLARIPELRVTSRSSAFSYKGKDFKIADVGRELNVDHVLEGSVRRSGDQIRITAQLIDVAEDAHIWSESWDRTLDDIFVVQDEIAQAVIAALKIRLLGEASRTDITSPEAYALYLQSKALAAQFTAAGFLQAEAVVLRVLEIDSTYVPAWLQLAYIYAEGSASGAWHPHEGYPKSRAAAIEALRLDADNAQAHAALSRIARDYDHDLETARKEQEIAVTLAPHDPVVLQSAARLAVIDGDFAESIRLLKEMEILDPVSWGPKEHLGHSYIRMGRLAEAKSAYAEALELLPIGSQINFRLGTVMLVSGDLDDALAQMNKEKREGFRLAGRAMVLHAMGDTGSAATELEKLIAIGDTWTYEIAQVHAYLGNLDESFRWLHRAIDRRDPSLSVMTGDPFLSNLRDDPRFDEVLERLGRKK
jgi:TolB-like protein/predicted negative regulator of RcsB-dependent stress response